MIYKLHDTGGAENDFCTTSKPVTNGGGGGGGAIYTLNYVFCKFLEKW